MMDQEISKKKKEFTLGRGWIYLGFFLFPFLLFCIFWLGFYAIIEYLHYSIGILLAVFSLAVVLGSISGVIQSNWIEKEENGVPEIAFAANISGSLTSIFVFCAMAAWISYSLYALGLVELINGSGLPTFGNLVQTYLWHLANLIPFINVEKTFGMRDPLVQFTGWVGGLPIMAFRFTVVVIIFAAIRDSWGIFQKSSEEAQKLRLNKRIEADALVGKDENFGNNI